MEHLSSNYDNTGMRGGRGRGRNNFGGNRGRGDSAWRSKSFFEKSSSLHSESSSEISDLQNHVETLKTDIGQKQAEVDNLKEQKRILMKQTKEDTLSKQRQIDVSTNQIDTVAIKLQGLNLELFTHQEAAKIKIPVIKAKQEDLQISINQVDEQLTNKRQKLDPLLEAKKETDKLLTENGKAKSNALAEMKKLQRSIDQDNNCILEAQRKKDNLEVNLKNSVYKSKKAKNMLKSYEHSINTSKLRKANTFKEKTQALISILPEESSDDFISIWETFSADNEVAEYNKINKDIEKYQLMRGKIDEITKFFLNNDIISLEDCNGFKTENSEKMYKNIADGLKQVNETSQSLSFNSILNEKYQQVLEFKNEVEKETKSKKKDFHDQAMVKLESLYKEFIPSQLNIYLKKSLLEQSIANVSKTTEEYIKHYKEKIDSFGQIVEEEANNQINISNEISDLTASIKTAQSAADTREKQKKDFENTLTKIKDSSSNLKSQLSEFANLEEEKTSVENLKKQKKELTQRKDQFGTELDKLEKTTSDLINEIDSTQAVLLRLKEQKSVLVQEKSDIEKSVDPSYRAKQSEISQIIKYLKEKRLEIKNLLTNSASTSSSKLPHPEVLMGTAVIEEKPRQTASSKLPNEDSRVSQKFQGEPKEVASAQAQNRQPGLMHTVISYQEIRTNDQGKETQSHAIDLPKESASNDLGSSKSGSALGEIEEHSDFNDIIQNFLETYPIGQKQKNEQLPESSPNFISKIQNHEKDVTVELEEMRGTNNQLEADIDNLSKDIKKKEDEKKSLEVRLNTLQALNNQLEQNEKEANNNIQLQQTMIKAINIMIQDRNHNKEELVKKEQEISKNIQYQKSKIEELKVQFKLLQEKTELLVERNKELVIENGQIEHKEKEIQEKKELLVKINEELVKINEEVKYKEEEIQKQQSWLESLKQNFEKTKEAIMNQKEENRKILTELKELKDTTKILREDLKIQKCEMEELSTQLKVSNIELQTKREKLIALSKQIEDVNDNYVNQQELKQKQENDDSIIKKLFNSPIINYQEKISILKTEIANLKKMSNEQLTQEIKSKEVETRHNESELYKWFKLCEMSQKAKYQEKISYELNGKTIENSARSVKYYNTAGKAPLEGKMTQQGILIDKDGKQIHSYRYHGNGEYSIMVHPPTPRTWSAIIKE